jgi:glycerol-3-phosphate dehydrogenase
LTTNPGYYDLIIIGGGIHGAGIAQAAAAHGYSVLALEQSAIAAGTSSRSSKLIHGGLRYLESAQFNLVRECLHERTLLLKNAPDLVELKPFYIPVYSETSRTAWQIRAGLSLYSTLGGLSAETRFKIVPQREWARLDGLDLEDLHKVFRYYDAQTDDALLTEAVMRSAQSLGAELEMPAHFVSAERHGSRYVVRYQTESQEIECETALLINAAGPWVNEVLQQVTPKVTSLDIDLIQGTHIILEGTVNQGIYYIEAPEDRRAVFVMPWKDKLMVGTTESYFHGNPAKVIPLAKEKIYLLQTLGYYFPRYRFTTHQEIVSSFAGLRVLPKIDGSAFSRPRDTIFHTDEVQEPRLVTIYGGKLTAYRATAERLLHQFSFVLPDKQAFADTRTLPLTPP